MRYITWVFTIFIMLLILPGHIFCADTKTVEIGSNLYLVIYEGTLEEPSPTEASKKKAIWLQFDPVSQEHVLSLGMKIICDHNNNGLTAVMFSLSAPIDEVGSNSVGAIGEVNECSFLYSIDSGKVYSESWSYFARIDKTARVYDVLSITPISVYPENFTDLCKMSASFLENIRHGKSMVVSFKFKNDLAAQGTFDLSLLNDGLIKLELECSLLSMQK